MLTAQRLFFLLALVYTVPHTYTLQPGPKINTICLFVSTFKIAGIRDCILGHD